MKIGPLGADADGTSHHPASGRRLYVRGALADEEVLACFDPEGRPVIQAIVWPSEHRIRPVCPLADACGGCTLQHQSQAADLAWKSSRVAQALEQAGYQDPAMAPPIQVGPRTRRRMDIGMARASDGSVALGLRRRDSDEVVDMTECHVLDPTLFALLAPLRVILRSLGALARTGSLLVNLLDTGPDLLLRTGRAPDQADRARLAAFAAAHRICRIAWQDEHFSNRSLPETLVQLAPARLSLAGRPVGIPPGAFLQSTREAEAAIATAVIAGLPAKMSPKSRVIELYVGCGTVTLALAPHAPVLAFEGDGASAEALRKAAGGMRIEVRRRDLARNPLNATEMRATETVVLDPPYGGSGRQIEQIALAAPATVIIVSCNPAALRRESSVLHRASYRLDRATTIDQFVFSPRIESVSVFRRENSRRSRSVPSR